MLLLNELVVVMSQSENVISEMGGYFGLELPDYGEPFSDAMKFQSARSALRFILEKSDIEKLYLPSLICDSIVNAVRDAGIEMKFYNINKEFLPDVDSRDIDFQCTFLLVNYFGLRTEALNNYVFEKAKLNFIIDNSQALMSEPGKEFATIYSPRKFMGLPDGGHLYSSSEKINSCYLDLIQDDSSLKRIQHLLKRLSHGPRAGYQEFLLAEASLSETFPKKMSALTSRIMRSVDLGKVSTIRRNNFDILNQTFAPLNILSWSMGDADVPLCYPLLLGQSVISIREDLAEKGIFCPTYWPEAVGRCQPGSTEEQLINNMLNLPCDQRYSEAGMNHMIEAVLKAIKNEQ